MRTKTKKAPSVEAAPEGRAAHGRCSEAHGSALSELDRLIAAACNASFDCGEWRHEDSPDDYEWLLEKSLMAKRRLRDFVAGYIARLDRSRDDALDEPNKQGEPRSPEKGQ